LLDFINSGFTDLITNNNIYCGAMSRFTGQLYFLRDNPQDTSGREIAAWNADPTNYMYATWKSKEFLLPANINFACCRVMLDSTKYQAVLDLLAENDTLATFNQAMWAAGNIQGALNDAPFNLYTINGDALYDLNNIQMSGNITFSLYVDRELKFERVVTSDRPFKLPSGYKGRRVEVTISGYLPVYDITLAQSIRELQSGN